MSIRVKQLLGVVTLLIALCAWAPAALAYRNPGGDVVVRQYQDGTKVFVRCFDHDSKAG